MHLTSFSQYIRPSGVLNSTVSLRWPDRPPFNTRTPAVMWENGQSWLVWPRSGPGCERRRRDGENPIGGQGSQLFITISSVRFPIRSPSFQNTSCTITDIRSGHVNTNRRHHIPANKVGNHIYLTTHAYTTLKATFSLKLLPLIMRGEWWKFWYIQMSFMRVTNKNQSLDIILSSTTDFWWEEQFYNTVFFFLINLH